MRDLVLLTPMCSDDIQVGGTYKMDCINTENHFAKVLKYDVFVQNILDENDPYKTFIGKIIRLDEWAICHIRCEVSDQKK